MGTVYWSVGQKLRVPVGTSATLVHVLINSSIRPSGNEVHDVTSETR